MDPFFQSPVSTEKLVVYIEKQPAVQSAVSVLNTPAISADQAYQQAKEELEQAGVEESPEVSLEQRQQAIMEQSSPAFVLETVAYALWFAGMAVTALCFLLSNIRFARHLKKHRRPLEGTGSACKVYICDGLDTPCLFGLIHPAIYLTPEEAADEVHMGHILAHETTHLRHFDHIWSTLRCVCLALHWYNPLVWLAAGLSRRDCELACDEATIRRIGEDQRISYGTTLIEMTCTKSSASGLLDIATTMAGSQAALKERIKMIAKKPKTVLYALIAVLLIAAVTAGCAFSGTGTQGGTFDGKKREIENAVYDKTGTTMTWEHAGNGIYCTTDCGTYNGYDILYLDSHSPIAIYTPPLEIAGAVIHMSFDTHLWGYRDGMIFELTDLYEDGLITNEQISEIAEAVNTSHDNV